MHIHNLLNSLGWKTADLLPWIDHIERRDHFLQSLSTSLSCLDLDLLISISIEAELIYFLKPVQPYENHK